MNSNQLLSKIKAENYYEGLEQYLKRFPPLDFATKLSMLLSEVLENTRPFNRYPPHILVTLIELNCVYYREKYQQTQLDEKWLYKLINHCTKYQEPYLNHLLTVDKSIFLALTNIAEQQFIYQQTPTRNQLIRLLALFGNESDIPKIYKYLEDEFGFNPSDWILIILAILTLTYPGKPPIFKYENLNNSGLPDFPNHVVDSVLALTCVDYKDVKKVREEYLQNIPLYLHINTKSVFYDFPILGFDKKTFLLIHPRLLCNKSITGIHNLICESEDQELSKEFSRTFEKYIRRLLDLSNPELCLTEKQTRKKSNGKVADYILEYEKSLLIIECKASDFSSKLITNSSLLNNNLTSKITKSFVQIVQTANLIRNGIFSEINDSNKPIFGITIILSEFDLLNSIFFINEYILQNMNTQEKQIFDSSILSSTPQILSINSFEDLIMLSNKYNLELADLIQTKLSFPFEQVGDWDAYLPKLNKDNLNLTLPFAEQVFKGFYGGIFSSFDFNKFREI